MEVEDRLAASRANIEHRAVSILNVALASEFGGDDMAVADDRGVLWRSLLESGEVTLGHDQNVSRRGRFKSSKT